MRRLVLLLSISMSMCFVFADPSREHPEHLKVIQVGTASNSWGQYFQQDDKRTYAKMMPVGAAFVDAKMRWMEGQLVELMTLEGQGQYRLAADALSKNRIEEFKSVLDTVKSLFHAQTSKTRHSPKQSPDLVKFRNQIIETLELKKIEWELKSRPNLVSLSDKQWYEQEKQNGTIHFGTLYGACHGCHSKYKIQE